MKEQPYVYTDCLPYGHIDYSLRGKARHPLAESRTPPGPLSRETLTLDPFQHTQYSFKNVVYVEIQFMCCESRTDHSRLPKNVL